MKKNSKVLIVGFIAGIISGLFSTGGGLILLPAFLYVLKMDEKEARATSIFCILPMVLTTSIFYAKKNYIDYRLGIMCAIGGTIGSFIGSNILSRVSDYILKAMFATFFLYLAFKMIV